MQEFGEEGTECPWCHATPYRLEVANYRLTAFAAGALTISYSPTDYNAELAEQVRIINKTITGYDDQWAQAKGVKEVVETARILVQKKHHQKEDGIPIMLQFQDNIILYCRGEQPVVEDFLRNL